MINMTLASEKTCPNKVFNEIRNVIVSMLTRCGMSWPTVEYDHDYDTICRADAIRRGYPMEGRRSLAPFISGGIVMSTTTYAHLTNKATRLFISIYTASVMYIDDISQHNVEVVQDFNERFVQKEPQGDRVLDCFATLLLELPKHFGKVASSLILTSTLNLVTASSVEYETQGMAIPACARRYPMYSRILSGLTEAYAAFIFPRELSLPTFIQAIPEMMIFINQGNDILSFYKEELAGESVNYISLLAAQHELSKHEVLWSVADAVMDAHSQTLEILKPHPAALDAFRSFVKGYITFHAGIKRYRLEELILGSSL